MSQIELTPEKLSEILTQIDNDTTMEYYYNAVLNNEVVATHHTGLLALLLMLVKHQNTKLFVNTSIDPLTFFGLNNFELESEHYKYYELLDKTNLEIIFCFINNEDPSDKVLVEFSETYAQAAFVYGDYFKCLNMCQNALARNDNSALCNFIKASIIELGYINKTPVQYKLALINYQKELIDKCNPDKLCLDKKLYNKVKAQIEHNYKMLNEAERKIKFTHTSKSFEETRSAIPEWTEEHDFYLRNKLLLNPLCNFANFAEATYEDLEDLPIDTNHQELFSEIILDYKMCRSISYSYYKNINNVNKREMSMVYSYAYSIFDKLSYLLMKVYNLNIHDDGAYFTQNGLFDVKISNTEAKFSTIKNSNILPLFLIMKKTRSKQNIKNAIQTGTFEHNELRNCIDHKSISLVSDSRLRRNTTMLLEQIRNAILYTFMLLHSHAPDTPLNTSTGIYTTYFQSLLS